MSKALGPAKRSGPRFNLLRDKAYIVMKTVPYDVI